MDPILNVQQAKEALMRVLEFLYKDSPESQQVAALASNLRTKGRNAKREAVLTSSPTVVEQTLRILRDAKRAMTPKEVEGEWLRLGLPISRADALYDTLHSTLLHLAKRGEVKRVARGVYTTA